MPQLAGCLCTICGRRISGLADGSFCARCDNPVHHACAEAVQNDTSRCSECGTLSPELEEPDRSASWTSSGRIIKHLFAFRGQISRGKYWIHLALDAALLAALFFLADSSVKAIALRHGVAYRINQPEQVYAVAAILVVFLLATWSAIAVTAKRLHAIGRPGTHCLLLLIPLYNVYLGLLLLFSAGEDGDDGHRHNPIGTKHEGVDLGPGNSLLLVASRHELNGEWDRALELYQRAAEELRGGPHREYAENCIRRLRQKPWLLRKQAQ